MSVFDKLLEIFNSKENEPLDAITSKEREQTSNNIEERSIFQVDQNKSEQIVEQKAFKHENNIHDIILDEPAMLVNGDGTKYYGPGDIRNTYDPYKERWEEDYDGTMINTGGKQANLREVVDPNDKIDDFVNNDAAKKHIEEKLRLWKEKNGVANYQDFNKKQDKPTQDGTNPQDTAGNNGLAS